MTYCAAWKFKNNVYMLADTAVTGAERIARPYSSVGQIHEIVRGKTVQEGILKIIAIHDSMLLCYSGSVRWALDIAGFMGEVYPLGMQLPQLIESTANSLGPFPNNDPVTLLIGNKESTGAELYLWESRKPYEIVPVQGFSSIGSIGSYHTKLTREMVAFLIQRFSYNHFPLILSLVQAYGIHENVIQHNVGGIIFGASLTSDGVRWQPDTSYLLYDEDISDIQIVTCLARNNALAVYSSINKERYLFHNYLPSFSPDAWIAKWAEKLFGYFNERKSNFYSFIRKSDKNIVIIKVRSGVPDCRYFRFRHLQGENYEVAISPELMHLLRIKFRTPDDVKDDAVPIGFSYHEA